MKILVINAGSSSLKYQLMDSTSHDVLAKGLCERIGIDGRLTHKVPGKEDHKVDIAMPTHGEAIQAVLDALVSPVHGVIADVKEIDAVGHLHCRHQGVHPSGSPPQPRQSHGD